MPDITTIRQIAAKRIADRGAAVAAKELGITLEVLYRLAAGGAVRKGTVVQVAVALGLLQPTPASIASTPTFEASR